MTNTRKKESEKKLKHADRNVQESTQTEDIFWPLLPNMTSNFALQVRQRGVADTPNWSMPQTHTHWERQPVCIKLRN